MTLHYTLESSHMQKNKSEKKTLTIIGNGGHAKVIYNISRLMRHAYDNYISIDYNDLQKFFERVINTDFFDFAIAVGLNYKRNEIFNKINSTFGDANFPNFIHPSVLISESVELGIGNVLSANVCIGPASQLGNFTIVNTGSVIEHDAKLSNFVSIAPGCELGGGVRIGERSSIGMGSTLIQNIEIGTDSVIGAKSLLLRDCPSMVLMFGSPAKVIRSRFIDEDYLHHKVSNK